MSTSKSDTTAERVILINELINIFTAQGFVIESAYSGTKNPEPSPIHNIKFGDQKNKIPDIIAYDPSGKQYIIGMVCQADEDIGSDETLTKFNVFLNCPVDQKEKPARVFVIVPASKVIEATDVITHYLHPEYWASLQIVSSKAID
jgi:hypothetical protein